MTLRKKTAEKAAKITTEMPTKRQDKLASLTSGTTKLVRRLGGYTKKQPLKKLSSKLEIGKSIQFEYSGIQVTGIIRYLGTTEFSSGKWCGIELTQSLGKHNGTINGKAYFVCRNSYGIFLRYNKVVDKISTKCNPVGVQGKPADSNMRITVKSVKAISSSKEAIKNDLKNGEMKLNNIANGEVPVDKSYLKGMKDRKREKSNKEILNGTKKQKRFSSKTKNVVVSSFTTPSPTKPIRVMEGEITKEQIINLTIESKKEETVILNPPVKVEETVSSIDADYGCEFLLNNNRPEETSTSLDETTITDKSIEINGSVSDETTDVTSSVFVSPASENDKEVFFNESFSPDVVTSNDAGNETHWSKIPRRVKTKVNEVMKTEREEKVTDSNKESRNTEDNATSNTCTETARKIRTFSRERHNSEDQSISFSSKKTSECERTISNIPTKFRSSKRNMEFKNNKEQNPAALDMRSTPALLTRKVSAAPVITRKTSAPTIPRKNTYSVNSKLQTSSSKREIKKDQVIVVPGGKHADSAIVMGNASVINASCLKKNSDLDVDNIHLSGTVDSSTVIQHDMAKKTKQGKTKKFLVKPNGVRVTKVNSKELQQEVDNLHNQLKERTDRINELETTLKNNNNNNLEQRNEFERKHLELENELNIKNLNITEIEGKCTSAQTLIKSSSKAFQALGIVIQYYLNQIKIVCKQLSTALEENAVLKGKNEELAKENECVKLELQEIMKKLDAEKHRCEALQKDLEVLASNHEAEIKALVDLHNSQQLELQTSLKKQHGTDLTIAKEEYIKESEKLKSEHHNKINNLHNTHKNGIQEILQEKGNSVNRLITDHGSEIKAKDLEHSKAIAEIQETHATKYGNLLEKLNATVSEKNNAEQRLEVIMKEMESDTKVQIALLPYQHLPAELQSLQTVLEMKNEELRNQRVKNMELEKKVDDYYRLQTKFDIICQENQSLKEALRKRALSERRLSVERDNLIEKFENEIRKVNLLSMEKEQLLWRASNPDLSTSLPNVFEETDDEGCSMSPLRSSGSFSTSPPIHIMKSTKVINRRSMNIPLSKSDYEYR